MNNTIVLIIVGVLGALFCFGGYTLRKCLPAVIGLAFGFMLGVYIRALAAATEVIRVGNLNDILQLMNAAVAGVNDTVVQAFSKVPDEAVQIIGNYLNGSWLVLPIVLAVVFCLLGVKFYRTTAALSAAFAVYFIIDAGQAAGSSNGMTAALIAGLVTFLAVLLLYNVLFIAVSSACGTALLITVAQQVTTIAEGTARVCVIVLFIVGIVVQAIQLTSQKKHA